MLILKKNFSITLATIMALCFFFIVATILYGPQFPGFVPHATCVFNNPTIIRLAWTGGLQIILAYTTLPFMVLYIISKRNDIKGPLRLLLFLASLFIFFCGVGHVLKLWNWYHTDYFLEGVWDNITGFVSLITGFILSRYLPTIVALPSIAQFKNLKKERDSFEEEYITIKEKMDVMTAALRARMITYQDALSLLNSQSYTDVGGGVNDRVVEHKDDIKFDFEEIYRPYMDDLDFSKYLIIFINWGILSVDDNISATGFTVINGHLHDRVEIIRTIKGSYVNVFEGVQYSEGSIQRIPAYKAHAFTPIEKGYAILMLEKLTVDGK